VIGAGAQAAAARRGRSTRRSSSRAWEFRSVFSREAMTAFSYSEERGTARIQPSRKTPQGKGLAIPCRAYSNRWTPVRKSESHLEDPRLLATRSIRSEFFFHTSSCRNPPL
jgi:hypothetical protein